MTGIGEVQAATGGATPDELAGMVGEDRTNQGIAGKIEQVGNGYNSQGVPDKRPDRNDPCHCGSKRKYKKCCMEKDEDLLKEAEHNKGVEVMHQMCEGRIPFRKPEAIKFLGAHTDGWMKAHLDDIKYITAMIRALKTFPAQGSNSFVMLDGEYIYTRDDLIAEYERSLEEMAGKNARNDYMVEYALSEFMKKDAFIGKTGDQVEDPLDDPCTKTRSHLSKDYCRDIHETEAECVK
jgi:hypothetical protein